MTRFLSLLTLLFILSSCGPKLSPFTQRLYDDQGWSNDQLKRIQFYLSEDLVLTRELRDGRSEIKSGQIKIIDGREVEQVIFKRNTPGVFVSSPKEDRFAIAFEDDDSNVLIFGPNPKLGNKYAIRAKEWNRRTRSGTITYGGREWRVSTSDAYASLMIPLKRYRNKDVNGRVVGGRKVD